MGLLFSMITRLLHGAVKLAGLTPETLEIEPGTIMNIWIPKHTIINNVNGETLYIPPKKPVVLLIHCFAMDGIFLWFPQVLALTRNYSVYVPDLLFFGGSTTERIERSASFQAEVLAKGMEILGVEKASVVGLSYGGMIGFEMAKLYPNFVKSLMVSACAVELTESISQESLQQLGISSWPDLLLPETVDGFRRMLAVGAHKIPWLPNFIYDGIFETMFTNRKERSELLAALIIPDKDANTNSTNYSQVVYILPRIHMLWGEEDKIFSLKFATTMKTILRVCLASLNEDYDEWDNTKLLNHFTLKHMLNQRLGARTTLERTKNAGHLLPLEKPIAYNRSLKRFLATGNSITTTYT